MLRCMSELKGYRLAATDGAIGKAYDLYFDDEQWTVRYLVIDTGKWLPGRKVLIPPHSIKSADWMEQQLTVSLTRRQIETSPPVETDKPVSRRLEAELHRHFIWTPYWGPGTMGPYPTPEAVAMPRPPPAEGASPSDGHLRSAEEVKGYHIAAMDGEIGHVDDFIVDDATWIVRYVVANTHNWLPGKRVLVAPHWFQSINWTERQVETDLRQDAIRHAPPYDPEDPVNREYENRLYDFHGRPKYWSD